jgi:hypothetical protein
VAMVCLGALHNPLRLSWQQCVFFIIIFDFVVAFWPNNKCVVIGMARVEKEKLS